MSERRAFGTPEGEDGPKDKKINNESATPNLDQFGKDLTKLASLGKLDPVIGREKEIDKAIQILNKRKKNNPILIGEPGVGKCLCSDTQVVVKNDETGEKINITIGEFFEQIKK